MARNYDNYGYDDEKSSYRTSLIRRILVIVMMLVAIVLIIYLLSSCGKERKQTITPSTNNNTSTSTDNKELFNYEDELIIAGKEYYQRHSSEAPYSIGDCSVVELGTLLNENLIDPVKFGSCNIDTTYLKVCLLNNGERQYITKLTCVNRKSY